MVPYPFAYALWWSKRPHPFMFAGQMLDALEKEKPFKMSGGAQLREYHHVEDIAASVSRFPRRFATRSQGNRAEFGRADPST